MGPGSLASGGFYSEKDTAKETEVASSREPRGGGSWKPGDVF